MDSNRYKAAEPECGGVFLHNDMHPVDCVGDLVVLISESGEGTPAGGPMSKAANPAGQLETAAA